MQLHLHYSEILQSELSIKPLNLVLVFQVNCPGCLAFALPLLEEVAEKYPALNAFALSTAFEDFQLNTVENTTALLQTGSLTSASKRYFERLGHKRLPYNITVPVVMDWFMAEEQVLALRKGVLAALTAEVSLQSNAVQTVNSSLDQRILPLAKTGRTFINNHMQGTPSWYLFNDDMTILESWFGHKEKAWLEMRLEALIQAL